MRCSSYEDQLRNGLPYGLPKAPSLDLVPLLLALIMFAIFFALLYDLWASPQGQAYVPGRP